MRNPSRKIRLAHIAAPTLALLLLAVDLMVRDPQPKLSIAPHGGIALTNLLVFIVLGLCVTFYGLYHERHKVSAYVRHHLEVWHRFACREVHYIIGFRQMLRF
ncbi:MAG: hypothetical protein V4527_13810 [Pseudomonadota bacterium]